MPLPEYYPYRSKEARDRCFAYLENRAAKVWPADSREQVVATTYGRTFVRVTGPAVGPALVLLHGAAATSLMWSPNISALSENFRTFAVDQIGEFGKSICTRPIRSLADLLAWLDELFAGLDLVRGINLLGLSYGGALAVQYALKFPAKLDKLVLLAPGNTVLHCGIAFWMHFIYMLMFWRRGVPLFMRWVFADAAKRDPVWVDSVIQDLFLNSESVERHRAVMPPVLSDAAWHSLKVPTLFLAGEHEVIYPPERAVARLKRVAPSVIAEIVPGAGHDLTVVQAQAVNRRILEFLRQHESGAGGASAPDDSTSGVGSKDSGASLSAT